jgi:hypothetical protein
MIDGAAISRNGRCLIPEPRHGRAGIALYRLR